MYKKPIFKGGRENREWGGSYHIQDRIYDSKAVACSLLTSPWKTSFYYIDKEGDNLEMGESKVRKLTPKECWRLMGFDDADFEKARAVNSDTQLYKQAGNSIVVNVLEAILKNLLLADR